MSMPENVSKPALLSPPPPLPPPPVVAAVMVVLSAVSVRNIEWIDWECIETTRDTEEPSESPV